MFSLKWKFGKTRSAVRTQADRVYTLCKYARQLGCRLGQAVLVLGKNQVVCHRVNRFLMINIDFINTFWQINNISTVKLSGSYA